MDSEISFNELYYKVTSHKSTEELIRDIKKYIYERSKDGFIQTDWFNPDGDSEWPDDVIKQLKNAGFSVESSYSDGYLYQICWY